MEHDQWSFEFSLPFFFFTFTKFYIIESIFEVFYLQEDFFYYSDQYPLTAGNTKQLEIWGHKFQMKIRLNISAPLKKNLCIFQLMYYCIIPLSIKVILFRQIPNILCKLKKFKFIPFHRAQRIPRSVSIISFHSLTVEQVISVDVVCLIVKHLQKMEL